MAKVYKIKNLIEGWRVAPEFKGKTLVCCRNDRGYTHIAYNNHIIETKNPIYHLTFEDHYGRGSYTLSYYEFKQKGINL